MPELGPYGSVRGEARKSFPTAITHHAIKLIKSALSSLQISGAKIGPNFRYPLNPRQNDEDATKAKIGQEEEGEHAGGGHAAGRCRTRLSHRP
jgi:hypothetical protein